MASRKMGRDCAIRLQIALRSTASSIFLRGWGGVGRGGNAHFPWSPSGCSAMRPLMLLSIGVGGGRAAGRLCLPSLPAYQFGPSKEEEGRSTCSPSAIPISPPWLPTAAFRRWCPPAGDDTGCNLTQYFLGGTSGFFRWYHCKGAGNHPGWAVGGWNGLFHHRGGPFP